MHHDCSSYLAGLGHRGWILNSIHSFFGRNGIGAGQHLDKGVTLVLVDYTGLHLTEATEDVSYLTFCPASTTYEQCAAEHFDVITRQTGLPIEEMRPAVTSAIAGRTRLSPWRRRRTLAILITIITTTSASPTASPTITTLMAAARAAFGTCIRIINTICGTIATIWR